MLNTPFMGGAQGNAEPQRHDDRGAEFHIRRKKSESPNELGLRSLDLITRSGRNHLRGGNAIVRTWTHQLLHC